MTKRIQKLTRKTAETAIVHIIVPKRLKDKFKAIAALRGQTMTSLLIERMHQVVKEYEA